MDIDGTLVMNNFMTMMGNFLITISFVGILTLCVTGIYLYWTHHRDSKEFGE